MLVILYCRRMLSADLDVTIRCQEDRAASVRLHSRYFPDEYGVGFAVEARAEGLEAALQRVEVWVWDEVSLPAFVERLAADYRGWTDERVWETNHLSVSAVFHTGGHVSLTWTLRPWSSRSDSWQATVTTWLEAGEQMSNLAADLNEFLPMPRR